MIVHATYLPLGLLLIFGLMLMLFNEEVGFGLLTPKRKIRDLSGPAEFVKPL